MLQIYNEKERENTYVISRSETYALFLQLKIAVLEVTELR